mmetsp:Transcript_1873/g.1956  ORF Transcript_1873/g.1956 Transcript_1873/m.1956 type:complete len:93 (-) Transcript_1873:455-733(-)
MVPDWDEAREVLLEGPVPSSDGEAKLMDRRGLFSVVFPIAFCASSMFFIDVLWLGNVCNVLESVLDKGCWLDVVISGSWLSDKALIWSIRMR